MKYIHIIGTDSVEIGHFGGATIGYILGARTITYAVAICNKHDRYVKAIGRDLVNQRLLDNKVIIIPTDFIETMVQEDMETGNSCISSHALYEMLPKLAAIVPVTVLTTYFVERIIRRHVLPTLIKYHVDSFV